jgi:hypothetical protein
MLGESACTGAALATNLLKLAPEPSSVKPLVVPFDIQVMRDTCLSPSFAPTITTCLRYSLGSMPQAGNPVEGA